MRLLLLASALMTLGFSALTASGCSCAFSGSICGSILKHDSMFLASVIRERTVGNEHKLPDGQIIVGGGRRFFTMSVVEDFSGFYSAGTEVEVETGMGGGDCGYNFIIGKRYLVDAYTHDGKLSAGICGDTTPEAAAGATLRELREIASGHLPSQLIGGVVHYGRSENASVKLPVAVPDVPVHIESNTGFEVALVTDADGVYEVQSLPPGDYTVAVDAPKNLSTPEDSHIHFKVPPTDTPNFVCRVASNLYAAGGLDGQVMDANGKGVSGFVSAYTHAPNGQPPGSWSSSAGFVDMSGKFSLRSLEAGTYWLYFEPKTDQKEHWFYPGTREPKDATPIEVKDGEPTTGLRLVVNP